MLTEYASAAFFETTCLVFTLTPSVSQPGGRCDLRNSPYNAFLPVPFYRLGPAPEGLTAQIYKHTLEIKEYYIAKDIPKVRKMCAVSSSLQLFWRFFRCAVPIPAPV